LGFGDGAFGPGGLFGQGGDDAEHAEGVDGAFRKAAGSAVVVEGLKGAAGGVEVVVFPFEATTDAEVTGPGGGVIGGSGARGLFEPLAGFWSVVGGEEGAGDEGGGFGLEGRIGCGGEELGGESASFIEFAGVEERVGGGESVGGHGGTPARDWRGVILIGSGGQCKRGACGGIFGVNAKKGSPALPSPAQASVEVLVEGVGGGRVFHDECPGAGVAVAWPNGDAVGIGAVGEGFLGGDGFGEAFGDVEGFSVELVEGVGGGAGGPAGEDGVGGAEVADAAALEGEGGFWSEHHGGERHVVGFEGGVEGVLDGDGVAGGDGEGRGGFVRSDGEGGDVFGEGLGEVLVGGGVVERGGCPEDIAGDGEEDEEAGGVEAEALGGDASFDGGVRLRVREFEEPGFEVSGDVDLGKFVVE